MENKIIKSNIEARAASLVEGSVHTSLFTHENLYETGIYLTPHQEYKKINTQAEQVIITVFTGAGELQFQERNKPAVSLHIEQGDTILLAGSMSYSIFNTTPSRLMCTELRITT